MEQDYTLTDAKARLSTLLDQIEGGDEVIITRMGRPAASSPRRRAQPTPVAVPSVVAWLVVIAVSVAALRKPGPPWGSLMAASSSAVPTRSARPPGS
jgi:antitoxin (DNA-binding transcriptional repressor) of toxin-antitoxin stability system